MFASHDIIFIAADPWEHYTWRRRHHVAWNLAKNNRVLFVEPPLTFLFSPFELIKVQLASPSTAGHDGPVALSHHLNRSWVFLKGLLVDQEPYDVVDGPGLFRKLSYSYHVPQTYNDGVLTLNRPTFQSQS